MPGSELTETQKRQVVTGVKVGGACIIGFIVAPMVFVAIQGLVGVCIAAAVFLIGWNAFPILVDACANMKLSGIKWIASQNPIPTLQNGLIKKQEDLATFLQSIESFSASIMTFEGKYKKFISRYPDEKKKFDDILSNMKKLLSLRTQRYKEAKQSLVEYQAEIDKASAIWDMSVEAAKMNRAAGLNQDDVIERIKEQTSLDAIERNMNSAFAELQTSLVEQDDEKDFSSKVIDVQASVSR